MMQAKQLRYNKLSFISEKQLAEHYTLYNGYINKLNETREKMKNADLKLANATLSELRSLKKSETFALNGIKLHEHYFENMGENKTQPNNDVLKLINEAFGSYQSFKEEFAATALAVRGWVILAYDLDEKKLRIFGSDSHDNGVVWNCVLLLILDVYEHAYFMDYGTGRKKYAEAFIESINWDAVNEVAKKHNLK